MICRLCLTKGDSSILIFSEECIQKYITKFLQLEITPEDPFSNVICSYCWEQLDSFQKYCLQIEEAQKSLKTLEEGLVKEEANAIFVKDLSPVKQEEQADDSIDNTSFKVDFLECLDANLLKVELQVDDSKNIPQSTAANSSEFISSQSLREKRKTATLSSEKSYCGDNDIDDDKYDDETDEYEAPDTDEYEEEEKPKKKKKPTHNRSSTCKKAKPKKLSRAMLLAREHDEIIKKHMKLMCDICSIDLADFNDLQNHFKAVHNRIGYAVCCNKKLKNRGLTVDHINTHNNPDHFKCRVCGKVMSDRFCMQRHMLAFHPPDDVKKFPCPDCPNKFASRYLLDLHSAKHVPEDKCCFVCKECGQRFATISILNSHIKRKHSTAYDRMCEICAKLFRHKSAFERHMEVHSGIIHPQVQCEECGSWLKDKCSLQKHMNNKHDHQEHICNICGRHSTSKSALQSHIKYMHETTPCFKCTFCEKSFKKAIKLKEHVATHTGEVLYTCPHCPTKFNAKSNLHSHRKKAHREEWERNRRCSKKEPTLEIL